MKVLNIKMDNILNFYNLELDFETNRRYSEQNYDEIYKIGKHKILSKLGIIGKNASGKTTIVNFLNIVNQILSYDFLNDLIFDFSIILNNLVEEAKYNNIKSLENNQFYSTIPTNINDNWTSKIDLKHIDKSFFQEMMKKKLSSIAYNYEDNVSFKMEYLENKERKNISLDISFESLNYKILIGNEEMIVDIYAIFQEIYNYFLEEIYKKKVLITGSFINILMDYYLVNIFTNKLKKHELNERIMMFLHFFKIINAESYQKIDSTYLSFVNFFCVYLKITDNQKDEFIKKFIQWIKVADDSIVDIKLDMKNKIISGFMNKKNKLLTFNELSLGTKKWIFLFPFLVENQSSLLVIDEIENSLHQKLSLSLLDFFPECNKQIIFTTHNPYLFEKGTRPDSVYYIDKDIEENSVLVRLSDEIKLEKKHVISEFFRKELIGNHPVPKPFKNFCFNNTNEK